MTDQHTEQEKHIAMFERIARLAGEKEFTPNDLRFALADVPLIWGDLKRSDRWTSLKQIPGKLDRHGWMPVVKEISFFTHKDSDKLERMSFGIERNFLHNDHFYNVLGDPFEISHEMVGYHPVFVARWQIGDTILCAQFGQFQSTIRSVWLHFNVDIPLQRTYSRPVRAKGMNC